MNISKLALMLLWSALGAGAAMAQVPSSCVPSANLLNSYDEDIHILTFRAHAMDTVNVRFPAQFRAQFKGDLAAIANSGLAESWEVFNTFCIHAFPPMSLVSTIVATPNSTAWSTPWTNGVQVSGNAAVDSFMTANGLRVTFEAGLSQALGYRVFMVGGVSNTDWVNPVAINHFFNAVAGVSYAEPNGMMGDGNDISVVDYGTYRDYTFEVAWGDCPAGCTEFHYWDFRVFDDCSVLFLQERILANSSTPVPFAPCDVVSAVDNAGELWRGLRAVPNPTTDRVTIEAGTLISRAELWGLDGRMLMCVESEGGVNGLNVGCLAAGVYILRVQGSGAESAVLKIVKQ